jgi:hypothetical protein
MPCLGLVLISGQGPDPWVGFVVHHDDYKTVVVFVVVMMDYKNYIDDYIMTALC